MTYGELAERPRKQKPEETKASIANKLNRGTFPVAFFVTSLTALGVENVRLGTSKGNGDPRMLDKQPASHGRRYRWVAVAAAMAAVTLLLMGTDSFTYRQCHAYAEQTYADYENPDLFEAINSFLVCEGQSANANGGILGLLGTLAVAFFTFTLWRSTDKLWEEAERQRQHLEGTAERQLRAYIRFGLKQEPAPTIRPNEKMQVYVFFENTGETPAVEATSAGHLAILNWPPPTPFPEAEFAEGGSVITVHPRLDPPWVVPVHSLGTYSAQEIAAATAGKQKRIYLYGWFRYKDVFGKPHFTNFRMMTGREGTFFSFCQEGNDTDD